MQYYVFLSENKFGIYNSNYHHTLPECFLTEHDHVHLFNDKEYALRFIYKSLTNTQIYQFRAEYGIEENKFYYRKKP